MEAAAPSTEPPLATSLAIRTGDTLLLLALASAAEALLFGASRRRELVGSLELALSTRALVPLSLLLACPLALALGLGLELAARTPAGRWVADGPLARRASVGGSLLAAGVALALAAARASRSTPQATLALGALAAFSSLSLLRSSRPSGWAALRAACALGLVALSASVAGGAARSLSFLDNVRRVYAGAPTLRYALALGARLTPPLPLAEPQGRAPDPGSIDLRGRDVLLVTLEAARADHTSAYGYGRRTTPSLDRLAEGGVVFESAVTPSPESAYALASLFTGKYQRPLTLLGLGAESETLAGVLRRYDVATAAFYPPEALASEGDRLARLRERRLDFTYTEVDGAAASERALAVQRYVERSPAGVTMFVWAHLYEPHEPYLAHEAHPFGAREVDRYDSELAAADAALGAMVDAFRRARPEGVVIVTADHGEEFGEHGGRFHGSSVYEEQVRVPLVLSIPGVPPRRVKAAVSLVDLTPTLLAGMGIPRPARQRGLDLSPLALGGDAAVGRAPRAREPFAFAETDEFSLFARGAERLVCARTVGTCALYDVAADPQETRDLARERSESFTALRGELRRFEGSHGRYELGGAPEERGLPEPLRRALGGDGDAALEVSALLSGGDVGVRRRAAEVLFDLKRPESASALRAALLQSDDAVVRDWSALTLARLGEGAPRARDLLVGADPALRRLAALALCEGGEDRGQDELAAWLREAYPEGRPPSLPLPDPASGLRVERARDVLRALARVRSRRSVPSILRVLDDPRLRSLAAEVLGQIGERFARPTLAERFWTERQLPARAAIAKALVALGGREELRGPLVRWMGTPDPMPNSLDVAMKIGMLELVGGPRETDRGRLAQFATSGIVLPVIVPKVKEPSELASPPHLPGARILCRASTKDDRAGELRVGASAKPLALGTSKHPVPHAKPELDPKRTALLRVPASREPLEVYAALPEGLTAKPGSGLVLVAYATQNVTVVACAVVPMRGELPP